MQTSYLDLVGYWLLEVGSSSSFELALGCLKLVQNFLELVLICPEIDGTGFPRGKSVNWLVVWMF